MTHRNLKSSLEAEVDLVVPGDSSDGTKLWVLLQREGPFSYISQEMQYILTLFVRGFPQNTIHSVRCLHHRRRFSGYDVS